MKVLIISSRPLERQPSELNTRGDTLLCQVLPDLVGFPVSTARTADALLLVGFPADARLLEAVRGCVEAAPDCAVVPVLGNPPADYVVQLMQAGAVDVASSPFPQDMVAAVERLRSRGTRNLAGSQPHSIAVISAKGGDGATCIAANLASALARCSGVRVMAIDLSLPFGDLDIHLTTQQSQNDLADVLEQSERLDAALLDTLSHHVSDGVRLISSPATFERFVGIQPAQVTQLVGLATRSYNFVVADLGNGTDPVSLGVFDLFERVLLVTTLDVPSLRRSAKLLRLWRGMGRDCSRVRLVVNRVSSEPEVPLAQFASTLGVEVAYQFEDEVHGVNESLLEGRSVLETAPSSDFSKTFQRWAAELSGTPIRKDSAWTHLKHLLHVG